MSTLVFDEVEFPISVPCAVTDMPETTYHADPCIDPSLSSTMAKTIVSGDAGPARLHGLMSNPPEHKAVFDFGSAAHEKILGRGAGLAVIEADNWMTKAAKQARQEAYDNGLTPVLAKEAARVDVMADAILAHPVAGELFTRGAGTPEYSMFTCDEQTGCWLRGRLDFLADRHTIVDYKTTGQSAEFGAWVKHAFDFGYHIQAADYLDMATSLGLVDADARFLHVVQETKPPYLVAVYQVGADQIEEGRIQMRRAIDLWDRCLTTGEWPGLPDDITITTLPAWVQRQADKDLAQTVEGLFNTLSWEKK